MSLHDGTSSFTQFMDIIYGYSAYLWVWLLSIMLLLFLMNIFVIPVAYVLRSGNARLLI